MPQNNGDDAIQSCRYKADFSDPSEVGSWRVLLDGVMGGRSTGVRYPDGDAMIFKGVINTNGGGFSSLRKPMRPGALTGAKQLKIRVKGDGRSYKMTFRTNANYWGRRISYQLDIPKTQPDVWSDVTLPLTGFRTSIFGRRVTAPPFDASEVREMGVILADGIDGPFEVYLKSITCS